MNHSAPRRIIFAGVFLLLCSALIGIGMELVGADAGGGKCACGIYPGACTHNSCDG